MRPPPLPYEAQRANAARFRRECEKHGEENTDGALYYDDKRFRTLAQAVAWAAAPEAIRGDAVVRKQPSVWIEENWEYDYGEGEVVWPKDDKS